MQTPRIIYSCTPFATGGIATSQRVSVGGNKIVRITVGSGAGVGGIPVDVWFKVGGATVTATSGTAGESLISAAGSGCVEFTTTSAQTHVALIAEGGDANARASVELIG